jgi:hypothetical protein
MTSSARVSTYEAWLGLGLLAILLACALGLVAFSLVGATYSDTASTTGSDFAADVLDPPSSLGASAVALTTVTLTWAATPDTYATGYRVMRSLNGGAYSELTTVTPVSTTMYVDSVGAIGAGQYSYYLVTYHGNWNSVASNTVTCTQVTLVLICA